MRQQLARQGLSMRKTNKQTKHQTLHGVGHWGRMDRLDKAPGAACQHSLPADRAPRMGPTTSDGIRTCVVGRSEGGGLVPVDGIIPAGRDGAETSSRGEVQGRGGTSGAAGTAASPHRGRPLHEDASDAGSSLEEVFDLVSHLHGRPAFAPLHQQRPARAPGMLGRAAHTHGGRAAVAAAPPPIIACPGRSGRLLAPLRHR